MRKQNRAGRIALAAATVLLCAVFVTTSVLSTTFAKYTTTGELDSETARVAKWGIELSHSPIDATKWSVVENGTSITAASSGTTGDNVIAPGTSGYLVCFKVTGNPEVAHNVTMNFNVTIKDGYEKLIGQDDYFPILISVGRASYNNGSNEAIYRIERHYYVPKTGLGTLANLISAVNSEPFTELIVPNGWSDSDYAEYYVRWDWFYNADDVPSYIPPAVKTALAEYQRSEKDTLLSKAMVLQLGKEKVKGKVDDLVDALEDANKALSGTPEKEDVETLETALATYLGVDARTYDYKVVKTYDINWTHIYNQGAMEIYDNLREATDYESSFNVTVADDVLYSTRKTFTNRDLCYFTTLDSSFPITDSTYYEMTFKAANYKDTQYAGVVFAAKAPQKLEGAVSGKEGIWRKPYFYYGGLGGNERVSDESVTQPTIEIDYCTYNDAVIARQEFLNVKLTDPIYSRKYGQYKVKYDGRDITCQYLNTSNTYTDLGTFTIDNNSTLAIGVESRNDDGSLSNPAKKERTMILRDVVVTQTINLTVKDVLQGLINEVQAIVDAHSTDRDFTISANATIAITQTKSEPNP